MLQEAGLSLSEQLASALLYHYSCDVRITALSLLIKSTSTVQPLSEFSLDTLQRVLPHFYLEYDAKARNELISLIKRLCIRLQAATARMQKLKRTTTCQGNNDFETGKHQTLLRGDVIHSERSHIEFMTWFHEFLLGELQPAASYQRHITALRSLVFVFSSRLNDQMEVSALYEENSLIQFTELTVKVFNVQHSYGGVTPRSCGRCL